LQGGVVLLPILIGQIKGMYGGRDRYLVALSGTETSDQGMGQTTFLMEDLYNGFNINVAGFRVAEDAYSKFIKSALFEYNRRRGVPMGSQLVLAGHSLGGMVAQNIAADTLGFGDWTPVRVITMGSPKTVFLPNVPSRLFGATCDPIPWLALLSVVGQFQLIRVDPGLPYNPNTIVRGLSIDCHMHYPTSRDFPNFDAMGDRMR
jgi:pimeloyl-ACP methyl ester carboxylesterase